MASIRSDTTDSTYLDAFLQGARFALFALEGRLNDKDTEIPDDVLDSLDEFHELFRSTRSELSDEEEATVEFVSRYLGRN